MDPVTPNYTPLNTPVVETPVFQIPPAQPISQPTFQSPPPAKKSPLIFFVAIFSIIVVGFSGIVLFQSMQSARGAEQKINSFTPQPTAEVPSPTVTPPNPFPTEATSSANPFQEQTNYENPFDVSPTPNQSYQNPFSQ